MNGQQLQNWYNEWREEVDLRLIYREAADHQIRFVRDRLAPAFLAGIPYDDRPTYDNDSGVSTTYAGTVIGVHRSKSVPLPVYELQRADTGLRLVLRDNFHDWNVTVQSPTAIHPNALRGVPVDYRSDTERQHREKHPDGSWGYLFFQGFPRVDRRGPYSEDPCYFSTWVGSDYDIYALVFNLVHQRGDEGSNERGPVASTQVR